eukprot:167291_1
MGNTYGGAKDINTFRKRVNYNSLPDVSDVTYEGLFNEYYFDTLTNIKNDDEKQYSKTEQLIIPTYCFAKCKVPLPLSLARQLSTNTPSTNNNNDDTSAFEYYMNVGLNENFDVNKMKRNKLNLMIVLDNSGSMSSNNKLENAKKLLTQISQSFGCTTYYYKFNDDVHKISETAFSSLTVSGGTRIEHAINKLYDSELRAYNQTKTKFIFVTDAEDQISNPNTCKQAKQNCENTYIKRLDSEAILSGSSGTCEAALRTIFGSDSFYKCSDEQFQTIFTKMAEGITITNKIGKDLQKIYTEAKQVMDTIDNENKQNQSDIADAQKNFNNNMQNNIKPNLDNIDKRNNKLENKTKGFADTAATLSSSVDSADTEDKEDKVEEEIETEKEQTEDLRDDVIENDKDIAGTVQTLTKEAKETNKIVQNLQKSNSKMGKKIGEISKQISDAVKGLNIVKAGGKKEIKQAKKKFREMLDDLKKRAQENGKNAKEISVLGKKVSETLKLLKRKKLTNDEYKKKIEDHLKELNKLLEKLDDK